MPIRLFFSFLLLASFTMSAYGGIIVGGTRVIYDGNKREVSLSVRNPDNIAYLIQSWADNKGPAGDRPETGPSPFIITPPLFRLDKGKENILRIINSGNSLPGDRESVLWMNVKSIPAMDSKQQNILQLSVKTRIKIFYRPKGLALPDSAQWSLISFKRNGNRLIVTNPTPFYITFFKLEVGNRKVNTTDIMVPPLGSVEYAFPTGSTDSVINWQLINDYGGTSVLQSARLK